MLSFIPSLSVATVQQIFTNAISPFRFTHTTTNQNMRLQACPMTQRANYMQLK